MKKQNRYYIIACVILLLASLYIKDYSKTIKIPPSRPITSFPSKLKEFVGKAAFPSYKNYYDSSADEWILRIYTKKGDNKPIRVFIGYWKVQNEKKKIKPPRYTSNRWGYYWIRTKSLSLGSNRVTLRQFLSERGFEKELVYYCYIINGKIISNEYYLRFLTMWNSLLYGKSNAALLRVSMPVTDDWPMEKAEDYEENFLKQILPILLEYV
jgi:EpsI family protein